MCVYVYAYVWECLQRPENGVESSGSVEVGGCELPNMDAES